VQTTIDGSVQQAATDALAAAGSTAVIVAVRAGSGQILAVARHTQHGMPVISPLEGRYQPGQSFTIVSAAALLAAKAVTASTRIKCYRHNPVGGQPFTNDPAVTRLGSQPTFSQVFANACSTEFAVLSFDLTAHELTKTAGQFGVGVPWRLPVPAVTGQLGSPGDNQAALAADTIGTGSVLVSPLDMALVAGAVDSGVWRAPQLVSTPLQQPASSRLSPQVLRELRNLMRLTVRSGAAKDAYLPGISLSGQVGSVPLSGHHGLRAVWFVGYRGGVAFAVLVFARSPAFTPAVLIASQFAARLP
jgi:cell division protein FtsI/penicillin-binding protein 2